MKDKQKIIEEILENYLTLDSEEFISSMVVQFDEHMIPDVSKEIVEALGDGWISVEDRLPEYTEDYNCVCEIGGMGGGYTTVRTYRYERIRGEEPRWVIPDVFDEIVSITRWKPLPELPEEPK